MPIGRRGRIRLAAFGLAAVVLLCGFALSSHTRAETYKRLLANQSQHAFHELAAAAREVHTALQKSVYSNCTHDLGSLYSQIYAKSLTAQLAIGELPYGGMELEHTSAFYAKAGDFASSLSRSGAVCSDDERALLRELMCVSGTLSDALADLQSDLLGGGANLEDVLAATERLSGITEKTAATASAFQSVESEFPELPALIYDGPFSDHLTDRAPRALEGLARVTRDEARRRAAGFLGLKPELFAFLSDGGGVLPVYSFSAAVDGGEVYIEVTHTGGQVLNFFNSRSVSESAVTPEQAVILAKNSLAAWGYPLMEPSYYINDFNVLTINFAAVQDGIYLYPDLVEVAVALDNGRVVGFRSEGYQMNHATRDLAAPALTRAEAEARLLPELTVLSHQLALIPSPGEHETLTHEFKCLTPEGTHIIVYINAESGIEEKILLLIEDETGTLTL